MSDKRELLAISNDGADAEITKEATGTVLKCLQGSCSASAKILKCSKRASYIHKLQVEK